VHDAFLCVIRWAALQLLNPVQYSFLHGTKIGLRDLEN